MKAKERLYSILDDEFVSLSVEDIIKNWQEFSDNYEDLDEYCSVHKLSKRIKSILKKVEVNPNDIR
jgi:hypothetical protein